MNQEELKAFNEELEKKAKEELAHLNRVRIFKSKPVIIEVQRHSGGEMIVSTSHGDVFVKNGQYIITRRREDGSVIEQYPITEEVLMQKYEEVLEEKIEEVEEADETNA